MTHAEHMFSQTVRTATAQSRGLTVDVMAHATTPRTGGDGLGTILLRRRRAPGYLTRHRKSKDPIVLEAGGSSMCSTIRRSAALLGSALAVFVGSGVGVAPAVAEDGSATEANPATLWMEQALDAVRSEHPAVHTGTPGAGRTYAMTSVAMYDAVNGIDFADEVVPSRGRALVGSYDAAPVGGGRAAAAIAAAHGVLGSLFSSNLEVKGRLDQARATEIAVLGSDPAVKAGQAWGDSVAQEVLSRRSSDGTQTAGRLSGGEGPGIFPRTFSATQFRNMAPFGVASSSAYRSSGPPPLRSAEYAEDVNEVKALGSLTDTNPDRAAIARHWLAEGKTVRETGLWFKAAIAVAKDQGTIASLSDTTRLFALLGMGIADGVSTSWQDKYTWQYWRPGDAIRQADTDNNPATQPDRGWNPRNGACTTATLAGCTTFGGTPEHTSGTSTFAGAASTILGGFYCRNDIPFTFQGEQTNSPRRSYDGFAQAAREAGRSRIYGGIHFQFSNDAGRQAGQQIGREITRTRLLPAGTGPAASDTCKTD